MTDVWMRDANLRANEEENYMAKWGEIKEGGYFGGPKVVEEDVVNKPAHYGDGKIECIDYMKDNMDNMMFMGYLEGNAKKYLHRYRYKGKPVEDLKKARWYLDRLIGEMEGDP